MNRSNSNLYQTDFLYPDLFALNIINFLLLRTFNHAYAGLSYVYTIFFIAGNLFWLVSSGLSVKYIGNRTLTFRTLGEKTMLSVLLFLTFNFLLLSFFKYRDSSGLIKYSLFYFSLYLFISRLLSKLFSGILHYSDTYKNKIVIIGHNDLSNKLSVYLKSNSKSFSIAGVFDDGDFKPAEHPLLGKISDCLDYAVNHGITEIYSTISLESLPYLHDLAQDAEKNFIKFRFVPDFERYIYSNYHLSFEGDMPIITFRAEPLENTVSRFIKRFFDITISTIVIIFILSWLIPLLALIIKLDSVGPVFFRQMRTGRKNLPFICLKLRSLHINQIDDHVQVRRDDKRVTRIGRYLRKTNLDEIPQFFNVFIGNMSIVGARPHMLKHTEEYASLHKHYMVRHLLKPGITGWAQVNGFRGEITEHDHLKKRVDHDIWYVENWNFWLDIKIILKTCYLTLKGDENAF